MLTTLSLRDFVIVDSLSLDVSRGFTVLTGETGAGKSILIDALELVLGGRADAGVVREGCDRANIVAEFSVTKRTRAWLESNELHLEDDSLMIRRTVDNHGRSRAWVNGIAVTVSQLRELGETLIDVHGQHAHQSLLKPVYQLKLLDDHAGTQSERQAVKKAYTEWQTAKKQLDDATANADALAEKAERLSWMIEDLEVLAPKKGEWEALNLDHKRLAHGVAITDGLGAALQSLTEGESSVSTALSAVHGKLSALTRYDERLSDMASTLGTAIDLVEEAARDVSRYLDRCDLDTESFERVDRRVAQYFELSRKFRTEPECLWELLESSRRKLQSLTGKKDVEALRQTERFARAAYDQAAKSLTDARFQGAKKLSEAVTKEMQTLAMKGACLEVSLIPNPPSSGGSEHCEFLIAGHAGVQPRPLIKVASGGELARISLAIAVITAAETPVPTLIFDEVDSGIGGATAEVVGRLLHRLGESRQVLCVTHLPQVASCGDSHWRVEKMTVNNRTLSSVKTLQSEDRVFEIARMIAGVEISQKTLDVAEELLQSSHLQH